MRHFLLILCLFKRSDLAAQDRISKIRVLASLGTFPEAPAILFLRSDLLFGGSDHIFTLAGKYESKIRSKKGSDLKNKITGASGKVSLTKGVRAVEAERTTTRNG